MCPAAHREASCVPCQFSGHCDCCASCGSFSGCQCFATLGLFQVFFFRYCSSGRSPTWRTMGNLKKLGEPYTIGDNMLFFNRGKCKRALIKFQFSVDDAIEQFFGAITYGQNGWQTVPSMADTLSSKI